MEEALKTPGCIGARMTGAGFGGCAIALVENNNVESFIKIVSKNYHEKTKLKPEFYVTTLENGVRQL